MDTFTLVKKHVVMEIPGMAGISMDFCFKYFNPGQLDPTSLIFARKDKIIQFNYETAAMVDLVNFEVPLNRQPEFFLMNKR